MPRGLHPLRPNNDVGMAQLIVHAAVNSTRRCGAGGAPQRETTATLIAGGIAGMATWGSIYPIDVVKSIVQAMPPGTPLSQRRMMSVAAELWRRNPRRFGTCTVPAGALGGLPMVGARAYGCGGRSWDRENMNT